MSASKKLTSTLANAAAGEALNVEDVFSTYLYTGNGSTQTITNGIDLDGEGGLVWIKPREGSYGYNCLADTERGADKFVFSDLTQAEVTYSSSLSFNSDGFSLGSPGIPINDNGKDTVSWTFRKAPKFFDVVTFTGNTSGVTVDHNLGSTPGFIVVKRTDSTSSWTCYHRFDGVSPIRLSLESTLKGFSAGGQWGAITDASFSMVSGATNTGATYVAYLFAHNDGDGEFGESGDQDIIKCGSFTIDGSGNASVDLGWEPQWLLMKKVNSSHVWYIVDNMRGLGASGQSTTTLFPNLNNADTNNNGTVFITPTGFYNDTTGNYTTSGDEIIYIAIRRPMKTPESGTEVFAIDTRYSVADGNNPAYRSGFPVDMGIERNVAAASSFSLFSRLTGLNRLLTNATNAESSFACEHDYMNGWGETLSTLSTQYSWMWKRATGFFDVVCYTGNGTAGRTVDHNLGVAPEMMIVKARNQTYEWVVHHKDVGFNNVLYLNLTNASASNPYFISASSDTDFTTGYSGLTSAYSNQSGTNYIAYLFASLDGISKVGSYTGDGNSQQLIDCGFSTGARFVLIKRTDSTGYWQLYDSVRGITTGNDKTLYLDQTWAEDEDDRIDPHPSGFYVNAPTAANLNVSGATYIFYAIA
jgi:hypothetical protein